MASSIYAALVLLAVDLWCEPRFKHNFLARVMAEMAILIVGILFSKEIAFYPAELIIRAKAYEGNYLDNVPVDGLPWETGFSELRVERENKTDSDYEDLDVVISPNESIRKIIQVSRIPNVSVLKVNDSNTGVHFSTGGSNGSKDVPMINTASNNGCRVRCEKLPKFSRMEFLMAMGHFGNGLSGDSGEIFEPWFPPGVPHLSLWSRERRKVSRVSVTGNYRVRLKWHRFDLNKKAS